MKSLLKKIIFLVGVLVVITILGCVCLYNYYTSPVDKNNSENLRLEVNKNDTFYSIGDKLTSLGLIRNSFIYKIQIKLKKPNNLQAGVFELSKSMNLDEIIDTLNSGSKINGTLINITIKEGLNIRKLAKLIDEKTENTYDDVLNKVSDKTYLNTLISKYWFLNEDILNTSIYYPLEGYLFPDTYQISTKFSVEEIFKVLLDQTDKVLSKYKNQITSSKFSIHQIMTLASIIELEAGNANDRSGVAGVFVNRINARMALGSDVTTYYALKIDDFSHSLTKSELNTCNNGYNTRCSGKLGLPVGPICLPGEESIKAAINPTSHSYYYFVADKTGKTYLTSNYTEHNRIINELKNKGLWQA